MYESKRQPLISRKRFHHRMVQHGGIAMLLVTGSLGIGMVGYRMFENLPWLDALLNTAMLLGGMGPVDPPKTAGGKIFASAFALYAGLLFIVTAALLFTPVLHRLMHRFHVEDRK